MPSKSFRLGLKYHTDFNNTAKRLFLECSITSSSFSSSSQPHSLLSLSFRFHNQLKTHFFIHSLHSFPPQRIWAANSKLEGPGSSAETTNSLTNICGHATTNALVSLFAKHCRCSYIVYISLKDYYEIVIQRLVESHLWCYLAHINWCS